MTRADARISIALHRAIVNLRTLTRNRSELCRRLSFWSVVESGRRASCETCPPSYWENARVLRLLSVVKGCFWTKVRAMTKRAQTTWKMAWSTHYGRVL
jgi:hypothetical protein